MTDSLQTLRLNGQAEQLVFIRFDHTRQIGGFQIIGNQWIVCGADTVLQGQIETGRRFARTGHAHQNHIRFLQVFITDTVIMIQ